MGNSICRGEAVRREKEWLPGSNLVVSENSIGLRSLSIVVLEEPAQALSDVDSSLAFRHRSTDQHVPKTLMATLVVVMCRVLGDCTNQRFSSKKDHLVKALRLDRSNEPLCVRVHIRCLVRSE